MSNKSGFESKITLDFIQTQSGIKPILFKTDGLHTTPSYTAKFQSMV